MSLTLDEPGITADADDARAARSARERLARVLSDHYDFVWRSVRRLGVAESESEDVAQEVFMTFSRRLADVAIGSERAFLYRTAVNHAAHVHRSRARRREVVEQSIEDAPSSARTPEDLLAGARARALCHELLDELSLEQRAVFVLFELEEMTMQEIADMLEVPLGTVASRLRRAREAFVKRLRQRVAVAGGA